MKRKIVACILLLGMLFSMMTACGSTGSSSSVPSKSAKTVLKFGHPQTNDSIWQSMAEFIKEYVESRDDTITIDIYPDCQLGDESTMMQAALAGTLDMVGLTFSELTNAIPSCNVCELPFFYGTIDDYLKVQNDETFRTKLRNNISSVGLVPIGNSDIATRSLSNKIRTIKTPADLVGLKLRVMTSPIYSKLWDAMGANPVSLGFSEVYTGLQQGVIDGEETGLETMVDMGFYEQEKYHTELHYVISGGMNLMSQQAWNRLTEDQQALMLEAGDAAFEYALTLYDDYYAERREIAINSGVEVTVPTAEELEAFSELALPVVEEIVNADESTKALYDIACSVLGK